MIDLDDLMLRRAEEQMARGSWRHVPRSEMGAPPVQECVVCTAEVHPRNRSRHGRYVCGPCGEAGWRSPPCRGCDGPTHKRDFGGHSTRTYGFCGECRARMRREM